MPGLAPEEQHSPAEHADQRRSAAAHASTSGRAALGEEHVSSSGATIRDLLASHGILLRRYNPGQQNSLICPKCKGGGSSEASFSVNILDGSREAVWHCHRGTCGWEGGCSIDAQPSSTSGGMHGRITLLGTPRSIGRAFTDTFAPPGVLPAGKAVLSTFTAGRNGAARGRKVDAPVKPDCSRLRPLSAELVAFFAARGISARTLARNGVLQDGAGAIAFPYRRDGEVVNLKYRTMDKKFWQARHIYNPLHGTWSISCPGMPCACCFCG